MIFFNTLLAVLGLIFGSFIAALSYRYPRGKSITKGRSICPNCKTQIAWFDNIPLFSYLMLWGKCRNCKKTISIRYPLIELTMAVGFIFIFNRFWLDPLLTVYLLIIFGILILIFVTDLENKIIPDAFVFFGIIVSIFIIIYADSTVVFSHLLAGFLAASFLLLIHLATRGRGMGLGDVKFAVLGGLVIGLKLTFIWFLLAFLTGGILGIILILGRRARLKDQIPFGPFLVIGMVVTMFWGDKILKLIFH